MISDNITKLKRALKLAEEIELYTGFIAPYDEKDVHLRARVTVIIEKTRYFSYLSNSTTREIPIDLKCLSNIIEKEIEDKKAELSSISFNDD